MHTFCMELPDLHLEGRAFVIEILGNCRDGIIMCQQQKIASSKLVNALGNQLQSMRLCDWRIVPS